MDRVIVSTENPTDMENDLKVEFRSDHILVELAPDFHPGPARHEEFWRQLKTLSAEHNSRRVLVEGPAPAGPAATEQIIAAGQRTAAIPKLWLAYHLDGFVPSEGSELYKVIADSHGVRVKFFSDAEHALMWLRNNTPA
jgi:hypothetical protein